MSCNRCCCSLEKKGKKGKKKTVVMLAWARAIEPLGYRSKIQTKKTVGIKIQKKKPW